MRTTTTITLLLSVCALATTIANAQSTSCSELFISEYAEGANNNKAIEIYNPTNASINLNNNYRLVRYNNGTGAAAGEANAQAIVNLGNHVIAAHDVWVIVIDKRDPNGTGQEIPVDAGLQAKADTFLCPVYNTSYAMYFNGNDAVSLQKNNGTTWNYVDIFAKIGDAAMVTSNGWSDAFPYDGSAGTIWTSNHTLKRKSSITQGVTTNPTTFNVTVEWDSLSNQTWSGLGTHVCSCGTLGVNSNENIASVKVFPNPASGNYFYVSATEVIKNIELYNSIGQLVISEKGNQTDKNIKITTETISTGIYVVKIVTASGSVSKLISIQ